MDKGFIIGGEFTLDPEISGRPQTESVDMLAKRYHPEYNHYLTGGGYYSLKVILGHLKATGRTVHPVLLPSFLCPTILKPFSEMNIPFRFYPVDMHLKPDINELRSMIEDPAKQAALIIPYFGFGPDAESRVLLRALKAEGLSIIEDRAQCLFPGFEPVGDYLFYSFRKMLPADGSLLLSQEELQFTTEHNNDEYIKSRREARELRHRFIAGGENTENEFLKLIEYSEENYYQRGIASFDSFSLGVVARTDIQHEVSKRQELYALLNQHLSHCAVLRKPDISTASPLCFPVKVQRRNELLKLLKENNIYAPVHWRIGKDVVPEAFTESHLLSESIISLPIRSNMPDEACHKMANIVSDFLNHSQTTNR